MALKLRRRAGRFTNGIVQHRTSGCDADALRTGAGSFKRLLGGSPQLQVLSKAPYESRIQKTECAMSSGADFIVGLCVRSELRAALRAAPIFCRANQRSARATASSRRHDEPSLKVRYSVAVAPLGISANGQFGKAEGLAWLLLG